MTVKSVNLKDIRIDGGTQFREEVDQNLVKEYKDSMLGGNEFPLIKTTFDGSNYWLWDGFHRYFAMESMGLKQVDVDYKPGSQEDAQDYALGANGKHGKRPSPTTKRNKVETALSIERHKDKSDREIAKLCEVSHPFVASIRNEKVKEQQKANQKNHKEKAKSGNNSTSEGGNNSTSAENTPSMTQDFSPSKEELEANEMAMQADIQAMNKLLESDDALATAHAEIKKLNSEYAMLESRFNALMREKDKAVSLLEKAQRELDKLKRAKK